LNLSLFVEKNHSFILLVVSERIDISNLTQIKLFSHLGQKYSLNNVLLIFQLLFLIKVFISI